MGENAEFNHLKPGVHSPLYWRDEYRDELYQISLSAPVSTTRSFRESCFSNILVSGSFGVGGTT